MSTVAFAPGCGTSRTAVRRPARRSGLAGAASGVAPGAPEGAPARSTVRLTRRGRLVLLTALVVVVFAALAVVGGQSAATGESGDPVETRTVEVGAGDTLWAIASSVSEPGQVREVVHQIEELNALSGAHLVVGQEIAVPVG